MENNQTITQESVAAITAQIESKKRTAIVLGCISAFFVGFPLVAILLIMSWTGDLSSIMGPALLLWAIAIPFVIGFVKTMSSMSKLKKQIQNAARDNAEIKENLDKKQMYLKIQKWKLIRIVAPIALVVMFLTRAASAPILLLLAFAFVATFFLIPKEEKKLEAAGGLSDEEIAQIKENSKKTNKTTRIVVIALASLLLIGYLFSGAGSSGNRNNNKNDGTRCRICNRSTTLIPGFNMCGNCYEGFNDWQKNR